MAIFYFFPLFRIIQLSFSEISDWSIPGLKAVFGKAYLLKVFWFTFWQALASTFLSLMLAIPGAYFYANYNFIGKRFLSIFSMLPFVLPTIVVAIAFQTFIGPDGVFNATLMKIFDLKEPIIKINQSIWFILLAHVFYNYSVIFRIVTAFWSQIRQDVHEAAAILGADPKKIFFKITLPLLKAPIIASSLLVFTLCFCSFGVILILGGPGYSTIEVEIYHQAVNFFNLPLAAALSLIQILFSFILMALYTGIQKRASFKMDQNLVGICEQKVNSNRKKIVLVLFNGLIFLFISCPVLSLIYKSFHSEHGLSLKYYLALFENRNDSLFYVPPMDSIFMSLSFALATLFISLSLGLLTAYGINNQKNRVQYFLDPLFMLPLSTSAVTLGFGIIISLDQPPLNLRMSPLIIPITHSLIALPFVLRSLLPVIRSVPQNLKDAARTMGATPYKAWYLVELPHISRGLIVAAIFAFTISLGEFGATILVARPQTPTISLTIFRFLNQPGDINFGQAMAMSSVLLMITAIGFIVLEFNRKKRTGELI
jgi:thiamine transport system permease protein